MLAYFFMIQFSILIVTDFFMIQLSMLTCLVIVELQIYTMLTAGAKDQCLKEKHVCNASLSHYDC